MVSVDASGEIFHLQLSTLEPVMVVFEWALMLTDHAANGREYTLRYRGDVIADVDQPLWRLAEAYGWTSEVALELVPVSGDAGQL